jgi:hypothetical protein
MSSSTLYTQNAPGVNVENNFPLTTFSLTGPHPGGYVTIKASQNQVACGKTLTLRLYIDGVVFSVRTLTMSGDSSAGVDKTFILPIPFETRLVNHRYKVTWSSTCGTGDMDSAFRDVSVTIPTTPRLPAAFGLPIGLPDSRAYDSLSGPSLGRKLGPWWINPATPSSPAAITHPLPIGLRLALASGSGKHVVAVRQVAPVGDFTISALVRDTGPNNDTRSGIFIATLGGKGNVCGPFLQDGQYAMIGVTTVSDTADWSGYDGFQAGATVGVPSEFAWFRIQWVSATATLNTAFSYDRVTWTSCGSRASMPVPTEVGLCIFSNGAGVGVTQHAEYACWSITSP